MGFDSVIFEDIEDVPNMFRGQGTRGNVYAAMRADQVHDISTGDAPPVREPIVTGSAAEGQYGNLFKPDEELDAFLKEIAERDPGPSIFGKKPTPSLTPEVDALQAQGKERGGEVTLSDTFDVETSPFGRKVDDWSDEEWDIFKASAEKDGATAGRTPFGGAGIEIEGKIYPYVGDRGGEPLFRVRPLREHENEPLSLYEIKDNAFKSDDLDTYREANEALKALHTEEVFTTRPQRHAPLNLDKPIEDWDDLIVDMEDVMDLAHTPLQPTLMAAPSSPMDLQLAPQNLIKMAGLTRKEVEGYGFKLKEIAQKMEELRGSGIPAHYAWDRHGQFNKSVDGVLNHIERMAKDMPEVEGGKAKDIAALREMVGDIDADELTGSQARAWVALLNRQANKVRDVSRDRPPNGAEYLRTWNTLSELDTYKAMRMMLRGDREGADRVLTGLHVTEMKALTKEKAENLHEALINDRIAARWGSFGRTAHPDRMVKAIRNFTDTKDIDALADIPAINIMKGANARKAGLAVQKVALAGACSPPRRPLCSARQVR